MATSHARPAFSADNLKIYKNRKLDKVTLSEIGLSKSGISTSLSPFEADVRWNSSDVDTPELFLEQVHTTTRISRKNVLLWYYQFNVNDDDDDDDNDSFSRGRAFDVEYRILSRSGVENALSHKNDSSSIIKAYLTEKPVECERKNKKKIRCLGRVDLDLDISRAKKSGKYFGTIEITIITI
ncbi:hypothetical protein [Prosthecochloris sp.]|uniref:hypothetical protein n=1 Tax=Prosthecochloris sp. TaxID=290513 RepID=UPI0025FFF689|nr:hypothetical protein [Prosthecochloris sp.]